MNRRKWGTVAQVAEYLALHPVTVRRLIDKGKIPASRIGRSVRVDLQALEQMMEEREAALR